MNKFLHHFHSLQQQIPDDLLDPGEKGLLSIDVFDENGKPALNLCKVIQQSIEKKRPEIDLYERPVKVILGIGETYSKELNKAGIDNVGKLL